MLVRSSGTGKTHLGRGLVRHWQQSRGDDAAHYVTAHDFRQQFIEAIDKDSVVDFRRRSADRELLAIDDFIVCLRNDYLLQELRYTLDAYEESAGVVLVTSHSPATRSICRPICQPPGIRPDVAVGPAGQRPGADCAACCRHASIGHFRTMR